jgi:hypothetical protein
MCSRDCPGIFRAAPLLLALLLAASHSGEGAHAADRHSQQPSEYQVKAAFVLNFIKFVEWPSGERLAGDEFRVCLLGEMPASAPFADLNGQEVLGRRLSVSRVRTPQEARSCQVLFVSASRSALLSEALDGLNSAPVLTVGDTDGYAQRGIMINMYLEDKRVRFEINAEAARAAGLRISAKLLKLAGKVYGPSAGGE